MKKNITLILVFIAIVTVNYTTAQDVLIEQPQVTGQFVLIPNYAGNNGLGAYSTDDFVLTADFSIDEISIGGLTNTGTIPDNVESYNLFIYQDNGGLPVGNPNQTGTGMIELRNIDSTNFTINTGIDGGEFIVDITGANGGSQVFLPAGTYWLVAFPTIDTAFPSIPENSWNVIQSSTPSAGVDPLFIDPDSLIISGATNWTSISSLLGAEFASMTFKIIGSQSPLSVNDNGELLSSNVTLYPNPTKGNLNINFLENYKTINIDIFNANGKKVLSTSTGGFDNSIIYTSKLSTGMYFAKITTEKEVFTSKFIKN